MEIKDVSDTSLWVAYYRAKETERSDALFRDPLAKKLIGSRGKQIADHMQTTARYTEFNVIMRTIILDEYIEDAIRQGVDTIINLGAGLDTRPYRMQLPETLQWIEVDYPNIIELKNETLSSNHPKCRLKRIPFDLSKEVERQELFATLAANTKRALILTEGVIIYLREDQVATLARDLYSHSNFQYWITEYFDRRVYKRLQKIRQAKLKNAPFLFFPDHWQEFFLTRGWKPQQLRFLGEEAFRHNRPIPMPKWALLFKWLFPRQFKERSTRMVGYVLLARN